MIDVKAAREAYNQGVIEDVMWIRRDYNLADAMTKSNILPQLIKVMETGKIEYEIEQSVQRQLDNPITQGETNEQQEENSEIEDNQQREENPEKENQQREENPEKEENSEKRENSECEK